MIQCISKKKDMDINEYERLSSLSMHSNSKHVKRKGRVKVDGFLLLLWFPPPIKLSAMI